MPTFETEKIFYFEVGGNITYTDAEGFPHSLLEEAVFGAGITLDPLFYMPCVPPFELSLPTTPPRALALNIAFLFWWSAHT